VGWYGGRVGDLEPLVVGDTSSSVYRQGQWQCCEWRY
jgi:hypothetical protein